MAKEEKLKRLQKKFKVEKYFHWVQRYWSSKGVSLDFKKHKYLLQIYKDQSPIIIIEKSAQSGGTERLLTEAMWLPDQYRENSLYLFPTMGTVSDLVQERVDEPINNSLYLAAVSGRSRKILGKQADKVGMKRMSKGFIYFRGATSPTQITSVPADTIFVDELDRMPVENIPYFDKRLEHSKRKWQRWASTPTVPNFGIDAKYQESDKNEFNLTCIHCGTEQKLTFWDNVDVERGLLICKHCKEKLVPWDCEGRWIPENPESKIRGYHISSLYSPFLDVSKMILESKKTAEWEVQQFYNQILGLPYEPKGAKILESDIAACIRDYIIPTKSSMGFMGIDVGKVLHVIIRDDKRILFIGTAKDFEELDLLMGSYNVKVAVVDAMPETRKAQEFVNRFKGRAFICWYSGIKEPKKGEWFKREDTKVNTDRTLSLDMTTNEIKTQGIEFPKNIDSYPDFKAHLKNLVRVVREEKGNSIAEYQQTGDDHHRHALNYASIAKAIFKNIPTYEAFML
jgi:hypothetical protein